MNYKPLPIGVDNFEKLITRGYCYVDKTLLIREILDKKADVNLFTRPRRFGKTLNMSMLQYFFEDARDYDGERKDNSYLFDGLRIMSAGEKYLNYMGRYPVISLSLKSSRQPDFEMAYAMIVRQIAEEYKRHYFILQGDMLQTDRQRYEKIAAETADKKDFADSLKFLSQCMEKYYGRKAIILIDEYDVPLENAYERNFYSEMIDFLRSLFESALKTNNSLEFAVITGCLRISKESIFTGMNNLEIISILSRQFDEYFGFTEEETRQICEEHGMPQKHSIVREWYNGYVFGEKNVYNPWSVIRFVKDLMENIDQYPSSYWANTSSNSIVRKLIEMADEEVKGEIEELIEGRTLIKPIHEDITYDEVYRTMDNLWNFMFFTGYFRKVRAWMDEGTKQQYVELAIPNEEVRYIFRNKVLTWFGEKVAERDRTELFKALINKDVKKLEEELSDMLLETISFNDAYESFYHGFIAGVLTGMKGYIVKSNREGGRGRSDIFIKPVTRRKAAFVIEFKIAEKFNELDRRAEDALKQIEERGYERELNDDGYGQVIQYGIAFHGKDCLIKLNN
ncbi:MAG: ATP-binding protein [Lachnospiraceae bacterium]|nr:ATP-binding protein [Lachnospiraceae bacterium]